MNLFKRVKNIFDKHWHIIFKYVLVAYALLVLKACEKPIVSFVLRHIPDWLTTVFIQIEETTWLNYVTFVVILVVGVLLIVRLLTKKKNVSGITLLFALFFIISYREFGTSHYICLPFSEKTNYRHLFDFLLWLFFVAGLFLHELHQIIYVKNDALSINKDLQDVGWDNYSQKLVDRINNSGQLEESFAIGITGTWGSGKTTFLKHIKGYLDDEKFEIIDFEPWACVDSNQIIKEFFKKLSGCFKDSHEQVSKTVKSYAKMISDIDGSLWISKITKALNKSDESCSTLKKQVEDKLAKVDKKTIIFIDDLDRLGHEELYEVLKLIRVTANFKNVIYIVAYDTSYIEELLINKGIKDGSSFLKKIINLEVSLPGYEQHHLPTILFNDLKELIDNEKYIKSLEPAVFYQNKSEYSEYVIVEYLGSFRDAKRFAEIFALNFKQFASKRDVDEVMIIDFFFIELLHYSYPKVYYNLKEQPKGFLYSNFGYYYTLRGRDPKDTTNTNRINDTPYSALMLLNLLFGHDSNHHGNSIRNVESFYEYFYYRSQDDKLSMEEYNTVLQANSEQEINEIIHDWFTDRVLLSPLSIHKRFMNEVTKQYDEKQTKNYLYALVILSRYFQPDSTSRLLKIKLNKNEYNYDLYRIIRDYLMNIITKEVKTNDNKLIWPFILNHIADSTSNNSVNIGELLLSNEDIEKLFNAYFNFWITKDSFKELFDFKEIFNPNSDVFKILKYSVINGCFKLVGGILHNPDIMLNKDTIFNLLKCEDEETFNEYNDNLHEYLNNNTENINNLWSCARTLFATKKNYKDFINTCVSGVDQKVINEHIEEVVGTTN